MVAVVNIIEIKICVEVHNRYSGGMKD